MTQVVYKLVNGCIQADIVSDDYILRANETFSKPVDGIYQPYSFENGEIVGVSEEEFQSNLGEASESIQDLVVNLTKQLANEKIVQLQNSADILKQLAVLQAQINGGNADA